MKRLGQNLGECLPKEILDECPYLRKLRANMDLKGFAKIVELGMTSEARAEEARKNGKKIICQSLSTGSEYPIIYASQDCFPTSLEFGVDIYYGVLRGRRDFFNLSETYGVAREMCAWTKGNLGSIVMGIWNPDLIVCCVGAYCDDAGKIVELLQWLGHEVHFIEVPYRRNPLLNEKTIGEEIHLLGYTPQALRLLTTEYNRFKAKLEDMTGRKITGALLKEFIKIFNEVRRDIWEILELRKAKPTPLGAYEIFLVQLGGNYMMGDPIAFRDAVKLLKEEVKDIISRGDGVVEEDAIRLAWYGNPPLDQVIFNQVEDAGGTILAWETPVVYAEINEEMPPIEALADNYLGEFSYLGDARGRVKWAMLEAKRFNIEGVIWNVQWGCTHSPVEAMQVKKEVERELGIPVLDLDTDMPDQHPGGDVKPKIEAFIEMVRNRRPATS